MREEGQPDTDDGGTLLFLKLHENYIMLVASAREQHRRIYVYAEGSVRQRQCRGRIDSLYGKKKTGVTSLLPTVCLGGEKWRVRAGRRKGGKERENGRERKGAAEWKIIMLYITIH